MAFFAVIREGLETAVFLLAVFQNSDDPATAGAGAILGIAVRGRIGVLIYRGGVGSTWPLLPHHRRRAGARRRGPRRQHAAHRARGGLAQRRPGPGARPDAGWSSRARGPRRCSPACSASSRSRREAEVVGYLVYLVPAAMYVLWPARPARAGARTGASAAALLLLVLDRGLRRRACGSRRRRAAATGRSVKLTDAGCEPATLKLSRAHDVQGHQRRHRPGQRGRGPQRRAHPGREGEPRRRPVGLVHAQAEARPLHDQLPGRHDRGDRLVTVGGTAVAGDHRPAAAGRHDRLPQLRRRRRRSCWSAGRGRSSRRSRPATSTKAKALFATRPRAVRDDRAGGRELRRPRPRDRRARQRRRPGDPWTGFHRIERRCGDSDRRAWARRRPAARRLQDARGARRAR